MLMAINQYPEQYWADLLPETIESVFSTNIAAVSVAQIFSKVYQIIDFAKAIELIENIPNELTGDEMKKIVLYSALLSAAKMEGEIGESEVLRHYFDVARSFDEFSQNNLDMGNDFLTELIKSIKDNYNGCYKSVTHSDSNVFMIKNQKYGEYLHTQSYRRFRSRHIDENYYVAIFSLRQENRTIGFKWAIEREKSLFWLKSVEFIRYMDTRLCDIWRCCATRIGDKNCPIH